jgi:hypothetical protein
MANSLRVISNGRQQTLYALGHKKMRVERKGRRRKKKKQRMETLLDRCLLADPDVAEGETRSPSDRVVQTKLCPAPTPPQNLFDWCERTELMS